MCNRTSYGGKELWKALIRKNNLADLEIHAVKN